MFYMRAGLKEKVIIRGIAVNNSQEEAQHFYGTSKK